MTRARLALCAQTALALVCVLGFRNYSRTGHHPIGLAESVLVGWFDFTAAVRVAASGSLFRGNPESKMDCHSTLECIDGVGDVVGDYGNARPVLEDRFSRKPILSAFVFRGTATARFIFSGGPSLW
jgi:hypothetical protein